MKRIRDLFGRAGDLPANLAADSFGQLSDSVLQLDERDAVRLFFDEGNARRLVQALWALAAVNAVYVMAFLGYRSTWGVAFAGATLVVDLILLRTMRVSSIWSLTRVRQLAMAVLIGHLVIFQAYHAQAGELGFWFFFFPLLATRIRLDWDETAVLYAVLFSITALRMVAESLLRKDSLPILELTLFFFLVFLPLAGLSYWLSVRKERRFLIRWRFEARRHMDRLRMKEELEYARQIQLSMLPRKAPEIGEIDLAALSLPATEVGGDYYDYFHLDEKRLAVVVGDVTGHGVASGLVLSGVRSCLNLLEAELERPHDVLARVNTMLKRTSTPRMLMTLVIAVLDCEKGSATVATAGHPPVLVYRSGAGAITEVGSGSFPLGAVNDAVYVDRHLELSAGDVLLMYSDGIVETISEDGELFGWQRLNETLAAHADLDSAKETRDAILRDVWEFKGNSEQLDDATMVVVRCVD